MIIKKLSKEELAEGLTPDLVNNTKMHLQCSPVQLQPNDEPCNILACTGGYWVMVDGKALRGTDNKYIIFTERECQVARARYLMNYGAQEKKDKVEKLVQDWRKQARDKIDEVKKKVAQHEPFSEGSFEKMIEGQLLKEKGEAYAKGYREDKLSNLSYFKEHHRRLEALWNENKIIEILEYFKIKKFDRLMLSVQKDDDQGMKTLKNTFSADALNEWDGDMLLKYAQIEIEKQYPI